MTLGDRVARWGSMLCGTIINDFGISCIVEWDWIPPKSSRKKRTEYQFKDRLEPTTYYNECWNAWRMKENGIPSVAPKWEGK